MPVTLALAALLTSAASAGCDPAELDAALDAAEGAFVDGEARQLGDAVQGVRRSLGCVRVAVPPATCARIHRARGLDAWLAEDAAALDGHLRAMLHAAPLLDLPETLVPVGHPIRSALILAEEAPSLAAEGPGSGWLLVDGVRTGAVPVGQPYVLQRLRADGTPVGAKLVDAGGRGASAGGERSGSPRTAVRWAGIGAGAVAAGLYGAAWAERASYLDAVDARDDARIGSTHTATNALSVGSVALGGIGAALLVGSVTLP